MIQSQIYQKAGVRFCRAQRTGSRALPSGAREPGWRWIHKETVIWDAFDGELDD